MTTAKRGAPGEGAPSNADDLLTGEISPTIRQSPPRLQAEISISWRKAVLLNRSVLLATWGRYFPQHDFATLCLIRPPLDWDDEAWARAARAYHEDRKRNRSKGAA
jgi:hypothetical protein